MVMPMAYFIDTFKFMEAKYGPAAYVVFIGKLKLINSLFQRGREAVRLEELAELRSGRSGSVDVHARIDFNGRWEEGEEGSL